MSTGKEAITKMQTVILATIIIIACIAGGVAYVYLYKAPAPSEDIALATLKLEGYRTVDGVEPSTDNSGSGGVMVCWNLYDTLVTYRGNAAGETKLFPALAESWEVASDGKTWTFHLRHDAKFSNGDPLKASAVVYNYDKIFTEGYGDTLYLYSGILSKGNYSAPDDYTVKFTTDVSFSAFPHLLAQWLGVMNPAIVEANGGYKPLGENTKLATQPLDGLYSGPYKLVEFTPGVGGHINLEWNQYWYGWTNNPPKIKYVHYTWELEASTRLLRFQKNEVDFLWSFPTSLIPQVLAINGSSVEPSPGWALNYLAFSGRGILGNDPRGTLVRKALCWSFPYQSVIQFAYGGYGERAWGPIPSKAFASLPTFRDMYSYNLTTAAQLLDEAGYTADQSGQRFSLSEYLRSGDDSLRQTMLLWQAELSKIGVQLDLREASGSMILEKMRNGETDIITQSWSPDYGDPHNFVGSLLQSTSSKDITGSNWSIPQIDPMIAEAMASTNESRRLELYTTIQLMFAENPGKLYYIQQNNVYVHRQSLNGYVYNPIYLIDITKLYKTAS